MTRRIASQLLRLALVLLFTCLLAVDVGAVKLGDAQITLQSTRYYMKWDLTRFVYRVKLPSKPSGSAFWVLGTGGCITDNLIDPATSTFEWVEDPLHGMRFELTQKKELFFIWLEGRWDVEPIPVAAHLGDAGIDPILGTIDGPACEEASISIDVISGSTIAFPALSRVGILEASEGTVLRVSSTSQGWAIGHSLDLDVPDGASYETVERIFQLTFQPYETIAGTVEIDIVYGLSVTEEDFAGLPEGMYTITLTFTATTD